MGLFSDISNAVSSAGQKLGNVGKSAVSTVGDAANSVKNAAGDAMGTARAFAEKLPGTKQVEDLQSKLPGSDLMGKVESMQPTDIGSGALDKLNHIAAIHQMLSNTPEGDQDLTPGSAPTMKDPTRPKLPTPFR